MRHIKKRNKRTLINNWYKIMSEEIKKEEEPVKKINPNLKLFTKENASEMGKRGAKASAEARARRKSMREQLDILLSMDNNQENVLVAMIRKALEGDVRAMEFLRDTVGEKPTDKMEADVKGEASINIIYEDPTK